MRTDVLQDAFGRRLDYLRLSVTESCQLRCTYCVPPEGIRVSPADDLLTVEELFRLAHLFVDLGVRKIRLTGGEPLLRKDLPGICASLREIRDLEHLAITTNGVLLAETASNLARAGLQSINVSIDSLKAERFCRITHGGRLESVLLGVDAAMAAGLPVKVNVVALAGLDREEVLEFCSLAVRLKAEVRFIEFMPLCGTGWREDLVLPFRQVRQWVEEEFVLERILGPSQVAQLFALSGTEGRVGFIPTLSEPFCGDCSRLRLTATGVLKPCLFSDSSTDLKAPLRSGASDEDLAGILIRAAWKKPRGAEDFAQGLHEGRLPRIRMLGG